MRSTQMVAAFAIVVCLLCTSVVAGPCPCNVDIDGDDPVNIDILDVTAILACVYEDDCSGCTNSCDVNCDGQTDSLDLSLVIAAFRGISADCESPPPVGACCGFHALLQPTGCALLSEPACLFMTDQFGATYLGDNTSCASDGGCVPTVSQWGLVSLCLLLLAGATIKLRGALPRRA